jgi:hypothetical protein
MMHEESEEEEKEVPLVIPLKTVVLGAIRPSFSGYLHF